MTQRFKRKTLAVSIAAAIFGGMALAVAPIMTPVAMANQFEGAILNDWSTTDLYTGVPANSAATQTGFVNIQAAGVEWREVTSENDARGSKFTMTLPADVQLWDGSRIIADPTDSSSLSDVRKAIDATATPSQAKIIVESVTRDSSGRLVVTFSIYKSNRYQSDFNPTSFTIRSVQAHKTTAGELRVDFADASSYTLGLGNNPNLKGVHIATFHDTSALVTAAAATSVSIGLTNQPVANVTTELLARTPAYSRILFTLDNGKWVGDPKKNSQARGSVRILNDTQLEYLSGNNRADPHDTLVLSNLKINAVDVPADTDINVTVMSQGDGTDVAIPGFGTHEVKVGRTKGAAGKDVTVGLKTDPTTDVLYIGRYYQTLTNAVTLAEAMPATLTPNGTLNYTLSTGVFNPNSELEVTGGTPASRPTCTAIGATASAKFECAAAGTATTTAGAWTLTPARTGTFPPWQQGAFNMSNATVGDLNVTIDGTAWSNWTSNVVKLADVKKATTSTLDGSVDTLRLGSSGTTKMTLPDIVIQENNAGALVAGPFVVAIDEGLNLNVLPTTEVKVFNKDGAEVNVQLGQIRSPSWMIGTGQGDFYEGRGIDITWQALPTANGPYKIVISGVQVEADSSTSPGDYNLSVASTLLDGDIRPIDYRSDIDSPVAGQVAGVYFETFPAVKVVDSFTTTAWVDASGPIDNLSAYANILPGIEARGKQGSYFLMLHMPPLFTGDWSIWTMSPTAWTQVVPATTDEELCSTMTSYQSGTLDDVTNLPLVVDTNMTVYKDVNVFMGYGVGASLFTPLAPCLDMLKNATYWQVYTVQ